MYAKMFFSAQSLKKKTAQTGCTRALAHIQALSQYIYITEYDTLNSDSVREMRQWWKHRRKLRSGMFVRQAKS
jgi:hypothetical protein